MVIIGQWLYGQVVWLHRNIADSLRQVAQWLREDASDGQTVGKVMLLVAIIVVTLAFAIAAGEQFG